MFQPQSTPFPSASFFAHGLDFTATLGLPQSAHVGHGEAGPTHRGLSPHYYLPHHSHSGPPAGLLSSSCATASLHPHERANSKHWMPSEASNNRPPSQARAPGKMEEHDIAAQQEAAKEYQPELQGVPVGDKTPINVITREYAKADPVYIDKTAALPETYSHYRPIQGDGNCGWRAIGFAYFERLVEQGDQSQVEGEVARLKSLNHLLRTVGGYDYFEDFAEEAFNLLREVAIIIETPDTAHNLIRQRWNDSAVEGSLIYYFRLLAATFLKANSATYEPFIPGGQSVAGYCSQNIEIINREIEHLGIIALVNILLKPVNFVLEIAYLDRSPGTQVNQYRFPEEANAKDASTLGPIIYLLYRPDHYDILYRSAPLSPPVTTSSSQDAIQVNRVTGFTHDTSFASTSSSLGAYSTVDFSALSLIPGLNTATGDGISSIMSIAGNSSAANPIVGSGYSSGQQDHWLPSYPSENHSAGENSPSKSHTLLPAVHQAPQPVSLSPSPSMCPSSSTLPNAVGVGASTLAPPLPSPRGTGYPIRFSTHQLEYESNSFPEPTFQVTTNTFKNSVWNRAHYGNPDFQPEEWNPEEESTDHRLAGKRKARKDS